MALLQQPRWPVARGPLPILAALPRLRTCPGGRGAATPPMPRTPRPLLFLRLRSSVPRCSPVGTCPPVPQYLSTSAGRFSGLCIPQSIDPSMWTVCLTLCAARCADRGGRGSDGRTSRSNASPRCPLAAGPHGPTASRRRNKRQATSPAGRQAAGRDMGDLADLTAWQHAVWMYPGKLFSGTHTRSLAPGRCSTEHALHFSCALEASRAGRCELCTVGPQDPGPTSRIEDIEEPKAPQLASALRCAPRARLAPRQASGVAPRASVAVLAVLAINRPRCRTPPTPATPYPTHVSYAQQHSSAQRTTHSALRRCWAACRAPTC